MNDFLHCEVADEVLDKAMKNDPEVDAELILDKIASPVHDGLDEHKQTRNKSNTDYRNYQRKDYGF